MGIEYSTIEKVKGPLIVVKMIKDVGYGEIVKIKTDHEERLGQVLEIDQDMGVVQIFGGISGLNVQEARVRFVGEPFKIPLSEEMLGRIFSGSGDPIDGYPMPFSDLKRDINGNPINPTAREYPTEFIQTGISSIDGLNTLVRGQKLPILSGAGLPHSTLIAQIARQSKVLRDEEKFAIVFAAMGITHEEANFFKEDFSRSGALERSVLFINLASDPTIERIATPRMALTVAEFLAFERNMHVLIILMDITNYCEALREIAAAREEIPSRRGYPGYMYTDLASIYERAGRMSGKKGSITQMPIITMPGDDITHPIPDLTGYITEGQIIMSRELHKKGIYPPIDVLPSLSRLMKEGIGEGKTRSDHKKIADAIYSAYSKAKELRELMAIVGRESLTQDERDKVDFAERFEREFIGQKMDEDRDVGTTLDIAKRIFEEMGESRAKG